MPVNPLPSTLLYGGDYNPEQWPEAVWPEDARLMREAGVNLVSLGIFSWARLQPREGEFDFGWLDRLMDLLAKHGIRVCLATATASPPPWLTAKYPDVLPVDVGGVTLYPGSRQHYSPSSPTYRRLAADLVRALATRYRAHPALAIWHINNEYACHLQECHNAASTAAFRQWLQRRYGTLDALNDAWGTTFWSQIYRSWDEIFTPRRAPYHSNPSQTLDFRRFTNDAFLECHRLEAAILREITPEVPVTTNFMAFHRPIDQHAWAPEVDFTSWDSYPDPLDDGEGRHSAAIGHDLTRSLKPGQPWVLMEQATSAVNWRPYNRPKRPGLMRLQSLQALARGADGILFFQWRASRAGAEKFHSALVPHVPVEQSRIYREVKELGAELQALQVVAGSVPPPARVAVIFDWHNWWACDLESKPAPAECVAWVRRLHRWFYDQNIAVDFVPPSAELHGYALVVAPMLYLLRQDDARRLDAYVQEGGRLLVTYFSGIVDEHERIVLGGYSGWLRETLGLWVEEWCPYPPGKGNGFRFTDAGATHACHTLCDLLHPTSAQVLATYTEDFFAGRAAFTSHSRGRGVAFYLGTAPDAAGLAAVLQRVCEAAAVRPVLPTPAGVEATLRAAANGDTYLFLLNHTAEVQRVPLGDQTGADVVTRAAVSGHCTVPPLGVTVVALAGTPRPPA